MQMAIERWHPLTALMTLRQAMDRLFEDSFVRPSRALETFGQATAPAPGCLADTRRNRGEGDFAGCETGGCQH